VQDDEEVVVVLVDLRALVAAVDVLVVERVEVEVLLQPRAVDRARALDVDPAQLAAVLRRELDDLDVGTLGLRRACDDPAARPRRTPEAWLGQVGHRDFAARRSASSSASEFALQRSLPAPCALPKAC
jgi:hypothetical protein